MAFGFCEELYDISISDELKYINFKDEYGGAVDVFAGCGKLKLSVRTKLEELGYKGEF